MKYLRISNPGVTSYESIIMFGVGSSRGDENKIGQFSSGVKFANLLMLRSGISPIIYLGNLKLHFSFKKIKVDGKDFRQAVCHLSGKDENGVQIKRSIDLSYSLEFGDLDWKSNVYLALREYMTNCLDGSIESTGDYKNADVDIIDESFMRAKRGYTQVYIPLTPEVNNFVNILPEWFLHFNNKFNPTTEVLQKDKPGPAKIYHKGVLIRVMDNCGESCYDYNVKDLQLNESRTSDDWETRSQVAKTLSKPQNKHYLRNVLRQTSKNKTLFEASISHYTWQNYKDSLSQAYKEEFGENSVLCNVNTADHIKKKGFIPTVLDESFASVLRTIDNLQKDSKILSGAEVKGFNISQPTDLVIKVADDIWETFKYLNLTNNKEKPQVYCMWKNVDGESKVWGMYDDNKVYVDRDIAGIHLTQTLVEEISHHCSGENDGSRGLQDYAFLTIAKMIN